MRIRSVSTWRQLNAFLRSCATAPLALSGLLTTCLLLSACGNSTPNRNKLRVGYLPIVAHLPAALARERGYYTEKGLDVEFVVFGTSDDLTSALSKGDIDIATTVSVAAMSSLCAQELAKGQTPTCQVFSCSRTTSANAFDGIFVRPDSQIATLSDLRDKKVGVFPGTTAKNMLGLLLRESHQIPSEDIKWVYLPPNIQLARLQEGDVDALYTYETNRTRAKLLGLRELHGSVVASVLDGAPYGCSAFNRSAALARPEAFSQFVEAFDRGVRSIEQDPAGARSVLTTKMAVPEQVAEVCNLEERIASSKLQDQENIELLKKFLRRLKDAGELPANTDVDRLVKSLLSTK